MNAIPGRRRLLRGAAGLLACVAGVTTGQSAPRRISLEVRKFAFVPEQITLAIGQPVILAIRTLDFAHGVSLPDFAQRVDCIPGITVELAFTPDKAGRFGFVCDNFCGEGHDDMSGLVVVAAA